MRMVLASKNFLFFSFFFFFFLIGIPLCYFHHHQHFLKNQQLYLVKHMSFKIGGLSTESYTKTFDPFHRLEFFVFKKRKSQIFSFFFLFFSSRKTNKSKSPPLLTSHTPMPHHIHPFLSAVHPPTSTGDFYSSKQ